MTNTEVLATLMAAPFDCEASQLYYSAYEANPTHDDLANFLKSAMCDLTVDKWLEELIGETWTIDLAIVLGAKSNLRLSTPLGDALVQHANELLSEKANVENMEEEWPGVLAVLDDNARTMALRRILREVASSSTATDKVLVLYGDEIASPKIVKTNSDRIITEAFANMLERAESTECKWIRKVVEINADLLSKVTTEAQDDFRQRLRTAVKDEKNSSDVRDSLVSVAEILGVKIKIKQDSNTPTT
jgi:hypothetical protein